MKDLDTMWLDCVYAAFKVPVQLAHHVSGKTLYAASLELSVGMPAGQETEVCMYACQLLSREMFIQR